MRLVSLLAAAVLCSSAGAQQPKAGDRIFGLTALHQIRVTIPAAEWAVLMTSQPNNGGAIGGSDYRLADGREIHVGSGFGGYFPWVRADIRLGGTEFKNAGIRYKGNLSFRSSSAAAPLFANFKIKIDQHDTKGSWDGVKTFNLHAGVVDTSKMREAIAYTIFRAAGVPAPRTTYAELVVTVPGQFTDAPAGLFTVIEDINDKFLEGVLPPGTGLMFKPEGLRGGIQNLGNDYSAYVSRMRPDRDATPHEQRRLLEFVALISQTDNELFRRRVGEYLDVDLFLRFIAVNALIGNTDSYLFNGHNYYMYLDPVDDKFRFIPWDMDLSMGARSQTIPDILRPWNGDHPLLYWLLDDPAVNARYRAIIKELATTVFTKGAMLKLIDSLEKVGTGRGPSPRFFIESQTARIEQLVASWK
jgi:hypothetical protein